MENIKPYINGNSILVDLGCGKGRVLFVASDFGFCEVRGVEFAKELCDIAKRNCSIYKSRKNVKLKFNIIESDVIDYEINRDEDFFFLFNPFNDNILDKVLKNISLSLENFPRKIIIIYFNPMHNRIFSLWKNFKILKELNVYDYKYILYSNSD